MSYHRPPSSSSSSDRRSSSGRFYDREQDYPSAPRSSAPRSRNSAPSYRSESPSYRSSSRPEKARGPAPTRPPSGRSSAPSGSNRRPPAPPSKRPRSGNPSPANKRRRRRRSPLALLLPFVLLLALLAILVVGLKSCILSGTGGDSGNYTLEFSAQTIVVGGTADVTVAGLPEGFTGEITWSSSDNEIVKVNAGKLTAKKVGTATISASVNGKNISGTVKVIETVEGVRSISITPPTLTMLSGKTYQLEYKVEFEQADAPALSPTWSSSNPAVVSVSKEGLVTARDVGSASITATAGNQSATCTITVEKDPNSQPAASEEGTESDTADENTTAATDQSAAANTSANKTAANTATSSKTTNTTTSTKNTGSTNKTGSTATSSKKTGSAETLALSQTDYYLDVGDTLVLEAYVSPAGSALSWSSANSSVATVSGGLVTAKSAGTVVITVKAGGLSQTCKINVSAPSAADNQDAASQ